MEAVVR